MTIKEKVSRNLNLLIMKEIQKKNTTISGFCRRNNIDKKLLYQWLNMDVLPSLTNACKLAKAFNVTIDDLVR